MVDLFDSGSTWDSQLLSLIILFALFNPEQSHLLSSLLPLIYWSKWIICLRFWGIINILYFSAYFLVVLSNLSLAPIFLKLEVSLKASIGFRLNFFFFCKSICAVYFLLHYTERLIISGCPTFSDALSWIIGFGGDKLILPLLNFPLRFFSWWLFSYSIISLIFTFYNFSLNSFPSSTGTILNIWHRVDGIKAYFFLFNCHFQNKKSEL